MTNFVFEGKEYDVPDKWTMAAWFEGQGLSRADAKRANKAWRQFVIDCENVNIIDTGMSDLVDIHPDLLPHREHILETIKNAKVVSCNLDINNPAVFVGFSIYGGQTHIGWNTPTPESAKVGTWQFPTLGKFGYADYSKYIYVWQG